MELDEADLRLVNALQIGPRLPWTVIGDILGGHPTSLAARWDRLTASGAAWITAHPVGSPDQMSLSFHDVQCDPARREDAVRAIAEIPDVFTIEECYRNRDMMLTVITPTPTWLVESVYPQLDRVPGLTRYETSFCTKLHYSAYSWRLDTLTAGQRNALHHAAGSRTPHRGALPPKYRPIIQELSRNGRATAAEIAGAVGLHPTTARRQLQKILGAGVLSFRCEVANGLVGYPIICQWFARLPAGRHNDAAAQLGSFGALRLCASTTGATNFMFMMWLRTAADIMAVEQAAAKRIPDLELVESVVIANVRKRVGRMLNRDGTATGEIIVPGDAW